MKKLIDYAKKWIILLKRTNDTGMMKTLGNSDYFSEDG